MSTIAGRTRRGDEWIPEYVVALDQSKCIGCGRCFKVCPRDVFELVDREGDNDDDDDEIKVMTLKDELDCIGCKACAHVCPRDCHTHTSLDG
jgi:Nif-specific ferredoxin III